MPSVSVATIKSLILKKYKNYMCSTMSESSLNALTKLNVHSNKIVDIWLSMSLLETKYS